MVAMHASNAAALWMACAFALNASVHAMESAEAPAQDGAQEIIPGQAQILGDYRLWDERVPLPAP
ncbi:MAG TPA: hypothetical protein PLF51_13680, partial [Candidatus Hydrogenedentes bacterium]|nr:hypothetical protein [Candidatus Hydrogenedentota bacterium]